VPVVEPYAPQGESGQDVQLGTQGAFGETGGGQGDVAWEGGREEGREGGRERGKEGGREGGRKGGREGRKAGWRESHASRQEEGEGRGAYL
jgi:hypothetical protein